jgi:hypothetical protein
MLTLFKRPFADVMRALEAVMNRCGWRGMIALLATMMLSWWIYVPLHEFFHAWGCLAAGGSVSRLEIDHVYGAAWLAKLFPYVVPGSEYAGRLSGFDTHGSDFVYLVTVFFPYLLTLFPGVPVLHAAIRRASPAMVGLSIPWALTPFLSLTGDYYESGSIVVSRWATPWVADAPSRWRSDDLPLLVSTLFGGGNGSAADVAGTAIAFVLGIVAAFLTYAAGVVVASLIALGKHSDFR